MNHSMLDLNMHWRYEARNVSIGFGTRIGTRHFRSVIISDILLVHQTSYCEKCFVTSYEIDSLGP